MNYCHREKNMKTSQQSLVKTSCIALLTGILLTPYSNVFAGPTNGQKPLFDRAREFYESRKEKEQDSKPATKPAVRPSISKPLITKDNKESDNVSENTSEKVEDYIDPDHEIPKTLLAKAITYYKSHSKQIRNKRTLGVIDFSQHNSKERFYLIDMVSGKVDRYLVAHGKNSDKNFDGYATAFSNAPSSLMSSQGFYLTGETYSGEHGYSLKLDGLSSTNSNARSRAIVIHPADYVEPGREVIGRSWGCPALDPRYSREVINRIKGGTLIYAQ